MKVTYSIRNLPAREKPKMNMKRFSAAFLYLAIGTSLFFPASSFSETVDPGFQRNDMHSCPPLANGRLTFVTGIDINSNRLLCEGNVGFGTNPLPAAEVVVSMDTAAKNYDVPSCPPGSAVTGIRADRRQVACAPFVAPASESTRKDPADALLPAPPGWLCRIFHINCPPSPFQEAPTQRSGMHACRNNEVVVGVDIPRNIFVCGQALGTIRP